MNLNKWETIVTDTVIQFSKLKWMAIVVEIKRKRSNDLQGEDEALVVFHGNLVECHGTMFDKRTTITLISGYFVWFGGKSNTGGSNSRAEERVSHKEEDNTVKFQRQYITPFITSENLPTQLTD